MRNKLTSPTVYFLLIVAVVFIVGFINSFNVRNAAVSACERANEGTRQSLAGFILDAQQRNIKSLDQQFGEEKQASLDAIDNYEIRFRQIVDPVIKQGVQLYPGAEDHYGVEQRVKAVYVNCDAAYPKPFPLG